ncbi:MAG: DUF3553 domain-containing protein [Alphaproteobacteria bacterium]
MMATNVPSQLIEPGCRILLKGREDWGLGLVQSIVGEKVTANFEDAGKQVILLSAADVSVVTPAKF